VAERVVLSAEGVVAGYGDLLILHGASVHVREREVVAIIGPNGAGKSTLLKAIFGLLPLKGGRVTLRGADLSGLPPNVLVERGMAYVPQAQNVFPRLSVRENLEMGAFLKRDKAEVAKAFERVHALFPLLKARAEQRVGLMSGGERQMVAMGRALMSGPQVLLLDEPSAGLAPNVVDAVFQRVREVARAGVPVLLVEQNAKKALAISDRGYVLDQGANKYEGTGADLLKDEKVGKLYLGG
jgi:branched-chain amino acid transport system ATP-binding protein